MDERTYGMDFVDYFPYYYQGVVYHRTQQWDSAILMFNIEEKAGAIKKTAPVPRAAAPAARGGGGARRRSTARPASRSCKDEVDRLRRESADLHKAGRYEDALSRLALAQKAAEALDPGTQRDIQERIQRIRDDASRAAAAAERAQRIEKDLAGGPGAPGGGQGHRGQDPLRQRPRRRPRQRRRRRRARAGAR